MRNRIFVTLLAFSTSYAQGIYAQESEKAAPQEERAPVVMSSSEQTVVFPANPDLALLIMLLGSIQKAIAENSATLATLESKVCEILTQVTP